MIEHNQCDGGERLLMRETGFQEELIWWRLDSIRIMHRERLLRRLKLPLIGCAISFAVGCTTLPSQQVASVSGLKPLKNPSRTSIIASPETQTAMAASKSKIPSAAQPAAAKREQPRLFKPSKDAGISKKDVPVGVATSITKNKEAARPTRSAAKSFWYATRQGDTLQSVAERFRISVDALAGDNQIPRNQKLIPGKVLTICTRERGALRPLRSGASP